MASPRQLALRSKAQKLRLQLFPSIGDDLLWDRAVKNGFATIPRAMPMILILMNRLSPKRPISSAYFALWCRAWDDPMVTLGAKMLELSMESGFSGQRAEASLTSRLSILEELEFVKFAPGLAGRYHYGLILNPYLVLQKHRRKLEGMDWNTLVTRMSDIGANDFDPVPMVLEDLSVAPPTIDFSSHVPLTKPPSPKTPPPPPPPSAQKRLRHRKLEI